MEVIEKQKYLFDVIKTKINSRIKLVDEIESVLNLSENAAYRRIRGEKELSFKELLTLCEKYNLSVDEILNFKSRQGALFHYAPVDFSDKKSYIAYIKNLLGTLNVYKSAKDIEMNISAQDIPFFYILDFPELMFFKLYAWNDTVTRAPISYSEFCGNLDKKTIIPIYKELATAWKYIPSIEIWTNQTIDTILRLIEYYYEIDAFENKESVLFLLHQLMEVMNIVKKNADSGFKAENMKTPFSLYLCNVDFENNFMLIKRGEKMSCTIRLFTVNSIVTDNKDLCVETAKWIDDLISKSFLISGTSYRERMRFFHSSKNKIEGLINKIEKNGAPG